MLIKSLRGRADMQSIVISPTAMAAVSHPRPARPGRGCRACVHPPQHHTVGVQAAVLVDTRSAGRARWPLVCPSPLESARVCSAALLVQALPLAQCAVQIAFDSGQTADAPCGPSRQR